jgi:hypothetical protein
MAKRIQNLTRQAGEWLWQQRFNRLYSPETGRKGDTSQLRLVLGVASPELQWVGNLLSRCAPRVRYYNEPLKRLGLALQPSSVPDRCAIGFTKFLPDDHPLLRVTRMLTEPDNVWATERMSNRLPNAEYEPDICLVKESRSLLASEAMVRAFECRTLLVLSEPVRAVDQFLDNQELDSYLEVELQTALKPEFLTRFLPRDRRDVIAAARIIRRLPESRERTVLSRAMAVGLINRMFRILGVRYPMVATISLPELANSPGRLVQLVVEMLGPEWRENAELHVGDIAMTVHEGDFQARRLRIPSLHAPLQYLTAKEAVACRDMLAECGLAGSDTDQLINEVVGISTFPTRREGTTAPAQGQKAVS